MFLVYGSLLLACAALIYFLFYCIQLYRATRPTVEKIAESAGNMAQSFDRLVQKKEMLAEKVAAISDDAKERQQQAAEVFARLKETKTEAARLWREISRPPNPRYLPRLELSPEAEQALDRLIARLRK